MGDRKINQVNLRAPKSTIPLVRQLFLGTDGKKMSMIGLADAAGYDRVALTRMRHGRSIPLLSTFIDVAEAAGFELVLQPKTIHGEI